MYCDRGKLATGSFGASSSYEELTVGLHSSARGRAADVTLRWDQDSLNRAATLTYSWSGGKSQTEFDLSNITVPDSGHGCLPSMLFDSKGVAME